MHEPRRGTRHGSCVSRADVVGNDDAGHTRYQTPASTRKLRSTLRACPPMRSAAADGVTSTLRSYSAGSACR